MSLISENDDFITIAGILANSDISDLDSVRVSNYIHKLQSERNTLQQNRNELKKWLEDMLDNENDFFSVVRIKDVLNKMQELEQGKDEYNNI